MKTLQLEGLGLSELKTTEVEELNGGWFQAALAIIAAGIYLYNMLEILHLDLKQGKRSTTNAMFAKWFEVVLKINFLLNESRYR